MTQLFIEAEAWELGSQLAGWFKGLYRWFRMLLSKITCCSRFTCCLVLSDSRRGSFIFRSLSLLKTYFSSLSVMARKERIFSSILGVFLFIKVSFIFHSFIFLGFWVEDWFMKIEAWSVSSVWPHGSRVVKLWCFEWFLVYRSNFSFGKEIIYGFLFIFSINDSRLGILCFSFYFFWVSLLSTFLLGSLSLSSDRGEALFLPFTNKLKNSSPFADFLEIVLGANFENDYPAFCLMMDFNFSELIWVVSIVREVIKFWSLTIYNTWGSKAYLGTVFFRLWI